ncbi:beta-1,4-mannosyl-glycoprotein 4-beta-N-acetylglucosaminyltransferase-like [Colossoma macropomum]|uniref:beta-1,4-mannosyl-glycoprotein 4-beta-N-acetylglucosaminyltransferase-like n=1 Tax=Colossoma macropomum TaxID=42526 RepID=UPI001864CA45|nr:beta-1,4-mannosyl-glycoprotein 4-beta-N-acetylglucosaminyltransferase-like [Colossoma macropomum]
MGRTSLCRMKKRKHKLFLFCSVGLCVVSFLYCYKTLHQEFLLRELSRHKSSLKSLAILHGFIWGDPLTSSLSNDNFFSNTNNHKGAEKAVRQKTYDEREQQVADFVIPDPTGPHGELHKRTFILQDDHTQYFIHTETGGLCFREGTDMASSKVKPSYTKDNEGQKVNPEHHKKNSTVLVDRTVKPGRKVAECVCRQGWHGPNCGVPTVVQHSNLRTKSHLKPRKFPRRIINAININHEFDLLHVRFHELADAVDLFLVCESNFTAYGDSKSLTFLQLLLNGTFNYIKHKILYIFLDHFPKGGRANGWIADDYLRTFLTKNGLSRIRGLRSDDVFVLDDADEIPVKEGILFLKLYDGWTEPFGIHMRKSLYGFYWRQLGTLDVISGCTVAMLVSVYKGDGILLRRREYFSMPGFRQFKKTSGHVLMPWSIGSPVHYAGWHCSWCFKPEGIHHKLISAQNGDFPRWGDFAEKRKLSYIRELIRTGGWFDGSTPHYPPTNPREHMFAPKYLLDNYERYRYLLENPYAKG